MTWLHAQLALSVLSREHARDALRAYGAHAAAQSGKEDRAKWRAAMNRQAGWGG